MIARDDNYQEYYWGSIYYYTDTAYQGYQYIYMTIITDDKRVCYIAGKSDWKLQLLQLENFVN